MFGYHGVLLVPSFETVGLGPETDYLSPRYWNDLSANLMLILEGLRVSRNSFAYKEYGIRLMLAPSFRVFPSYEAKQRLEIRFHVEKGADFSEDSVENSWWKESANENSSKFILCFDSSFVEFAQPCFYFSRSVLVLPSNWFPLTRVRWLPLMANSFAVSGMVIAESGVGATTWSAAHNSWVLRQFSGVEVGSFIDRMELFCFVDEVCDSEYVQVQPDGKCGAQNTLCDVLGELMHYFDQAFNSFDFEEKCGAHWDVFK
ncbi:hypothetical protein Tco_0774501 [Tanacetum coccineum]|uniref:Uncharacterized protein n=1 Tax=Tanacetum coccineum TaxID=301880 RepID=A0ABQ4ZPL0_9ASTR